MNDVPSFHQIKKLAKEVRDKAREAYVLENQRARSAAGESFGSYMASRDNAKEHFNELTEYIVPGFLECAVANPALLEPIIADLKKARDRLATDEINSKHNIILDKVDDWEGDGADTFESLSFKDFITIRENQRVVLAVMYLGLEANKKALEECRRDVGWIGGKTKEALQAIIDGGGMSDEVAAKILVGIIGVAITAATGGGAAALTATALSGAVGVLEEQFKVKTTDEGKSSGRYKIGGDTVDDVLTSMNESLTRAWQDVNDAEKDIAESMREAKGQIEATRHEDYEPRRPALADMKGADLIGDKGMGLVTG